LQRKFTNRCGRGIAAGPGDIGKGGRWMKLRAAAGSGWARGQGVVAVARRQQRAPIPLFVGAAEERERAARFLRAARGDR